MCGIFGIVAQPNGKYQSRELEALARILFTKSETRGKDASGVLAVTEHSILVHKAPTRATQLLKSPQYSKIMRQAAKSLISGQPYVIAGHTRMVTNGSNQNDGDNQPVIGNNLVALHNGIIVNDLALWQTHSHLNRNQQVDTEIFVALLEDYIQRGNTTTSAMKKTFAEIQGANTIAAIHSANNYIVASTTNGSLYHWESRDMGIDIFASEEFIVKEAVQSIEKKYNFLHQNIKQIDAYSMLSIPLRQPEFVGIGEFDLENDSSSSQRYREITNIGRLDPEKKFNFFAHQNSIIDIEKQMRFDLTGIESLKRCVKCVLPETFPFIEFDDSGVCQFCRQHRSIKVHGQESLNALADQIRRKDQRPNVLVPISGGRDSCYCLHYTQEVLGLKPLAYTYDWGFVTDLARRNISRMCGKLNVEHIIVAADIKWKRENVRKNLEAWLKFPQLSMVPLLMAGDKHFFYYASMIKQQQKIDMILFSMNWLEQTGFKAGFAGVNETTAHEKTHGMTLMNQFKMILNYGVNFLRNPRYLNGSLVDTLTGYASYYLSDKDYEQLFDFIAWREADLERTLIDHYDWETSPDTTSTWRIGDGTAPFYNYIYITAAGFSEHDTFRSKQIREGLITREAALKCIYKENLPRVESFKWYCDAVGIDAIKSIKVINAMPKLYN